MTESRPVYSVNGVTFTDGDIAEAYAMQIATRDGVPVHMMEKLDGLPAARVATYNSPD